MIYLQIFFTSLLITLFTTPLLIEYFIKNKVVDLPGEERKIHKGIMPRMGGIVIFSIVSLMLFSFSKDLNDIRLLIIASLLIVICGILDDVITIRWDVKFILQFLASFLVMVYIFGKVDEVYLLSYRIPSPLNYIIIFFFIVGVINSINLMDGLDGLVAGYSIIKFSVLLVLAFMFRDSLLLILCTALLGSLIGFIKFNAFPARIFLGDTGSLSLGFFLVVTTLITAINIGGGSTIDLMFPIILLAMPIFDTLKVMYIRILNGNNPFHPDKNHLHHIILGSDVRHKTSVFIVQMYSLIFSILALYYVQYHKLIAITLFLVFVLLLLFTNQLLPKTEGFIYIKKIYELIGRLPAKFVFLFNNYLISLSSIAVVVLLLSTFPVGLTMDKKYIIVLLMAGIMMLVLSIFHNRKSRDLYHIYVFFNIAIFFSVYFLLDYSNNGIVVPVVLASKLSFYSSLVVLLAIVVLFLLARDKIITKDEIFLTGVDLILIVFVTLTFVINNMISIKWMGMVSSSASISFLLYIWYRIISSIHHKYSKLFFYASYSLPFLIILSLAYNLI